MIVNCFKPIEDPDSVIFDSDKVRTSTKIKMKCVVPSCGNKQEHTSVDVSFHLLLTRARNTKSDQDSSGDFRHHLEVPASNQLASRTPGAGSTASGRSRKCSIVQEEDDEDEIPATNRDELQAPLSRRGSRSEGRINIALQDRIPEAERLKKENSNVVPAKSIQEAATHFGHSCPGRLKLVNKDINCIRARLGGLTGGISKQSLDQNNYTGQILTSNDNSRSNNRKLSGIEQRLTSVNEKVIETVKIAHTDATQTKFLVDSSTITIPINSTKLKISSGMNSIPKYNTMPSLNKSVAIIMEGASALKEIFEEGTDMGSSDSGTTTPRPIIRGTNFTSNRAIQNTPKTLRRSKFHKSRTPSCSSSEASDDDSESRKKRAHKINIEGSSKPTPTQRRDSHDDSSDSQDQGTATASGGTSSTTIYLLPSSTTSTGDSTQTSANERQNSSSTKNECQTTDQAPIIFRRHRTGRRRAGETRLRESQSLNRIAEVQESDLPPIISSTGSHVHSGNNAFRNSNVHVNKRVETTIKNNLNCNQKPKGISARLFHGFVKKPEVIQAPINADTEHPKASADLASNSDVDMVFGIDFAKPALQTKCSSATKKLKMLGRYFQVHKKICIPLPGLFQRGRLYKAQSCGSIVRDKVNHNIHNNAPSNTTRHSVLLNEKGKMLRNCLGSRFLGNSESDINQNNEKSAMHNKISTSLLFHIPTSKTSALGISQKPKSQITATIVSTTPSIAIPAQNFSMANKNSTSSLHQLNDVPLFSSKC